jgi:glycosyltransferase involved in cell wall biosynthesis
VEFVHVPLADSLDPQVLEVKAALDRGHLPDSFARLSDALTESLAAATAGADWIIAHNVCSLNKNLILTSALRRVVEMPASPGIILWHHDLAWTADRYRAELHPGYPWDLLRTAWPDAIQVTISEARRRELAALFGIDQDRIHVIPNGLDPARFFKLEGQTDVLVRELSLLEGWPILLLPVRITPRKNIELALHVLAALRRRRPRSMLVVTGPLGAHNATNREYFERLLALRQDLDLAGAAFFLAERSSEFTPDEVIADFYRLADLLFLPSREEGFGIPLLEAGLSGLAIFCADLPTLRELGGEHAHYFSPDAPAEKIADEISNHLDSSGVLALRERVRSQYTWPRIYSQQILPLLRSRAG